MPSFDLIYANERIDFIKQTSATMIDLYKKLENTHSSEDMIALKELYSSVCSYISDYYKYLEETGIPAEESYLTKWLDEDHVRNYFEDIGYLVEE